MKQALYPRKVTRLKLELPAVKQTTTHRADHSPHWKDWSEESAEVHHISRNLLSEYGIKADIVAHELNELLTGETVYCDSVTWDGFWAGVLFSDCGIQQRFDIKDISELLPQNSMLAGKYFGHKQFVFMTGEYTEHRALDDAKVIWNCLDVALNA